MERSYQFDRMEAKPVKGALVEPRPRKPKGQTNGKNPVSCVFTKSYRDWGKFDSSAPKRKKVTFSKQYKTDLLEEMTQTIGLVCKKLEQDPCNNKALKMLGRLVDGFYLMAMREHEKNYSKLGVAISYAQNKDMLNGVVRNLKTVPDEWKLKLKAIDEKVTLFLGVASDIGGCLMHH